MNEMERKRQLHESLTRPGQELLALSQDQREEYVEALSLYYCALKMVLMRMRRRVKPGSLAEDYSFIGDCASDNFTEERNRECQEKENAT